MSSAIELAGSGPFSIERLIEKAIEKESPLEVMEKLLAIQKEAQAEIARRSFFDALAKFQSECPIINKGDAVDYKSKSGTRVNYKYASIDAIVSSVKAPLMANGFSYTITTRQEPTSVTAICTAHHKDGHSEATDFTIPVDPDAFMNAAQKVASALTYAKRYAFCNAFGIITGDTDDDSRTTGEPEEETPGVWSQVLDGDGNPARAPQSYWAKKGERAAQQSALTSAFGPAMAYDVRKSDDGKWYVWRKTEQATDTLGDIRQAVSDAKSATEAPRAPADDSPATEYKSLEEECGRLSHLLGADTVTSVREQIASWRDKYRTGDITPYIELLKGLKAELSGKVVDKGELF